MLPMIICSVCWVRCGFVLTLPLVQVESEVCGSRELTKPLVRWSYRLPALLSFPVVVMIL